MESKRASLEYRIRSLEHENDIVKKCHAAELERVRNKGASPNNYARPSYQSIGDHIFVEPTSYANLAPTNDFPSASRGKLGVISMKFKKLSKEEDEMSYF